MKRLFNRWRSARTTHKLQKRIDELEVEILAMEGTVDKAEDRALESGRRLVELESLIEALIETYESLKEPPA